jgi:excisionase family DNA binding protein
MQTDTTIPLPDLTIEQVSERLNVSVRTLREWMKDDMKCYWKKGNTIRFPQTWLNNWIINRAQQPQK